MKKCFCNDTDNSAEWGAIVGTVSDQTDLVEYITDKNDILNKRMDNIVSAVTSDTEVIDARVGYDGETYSSLYNSITTNDKKLDNKMIGMYNLFVSLTNIDGITITRTSDKKLQVHIISKSNVDDNFFTDNILKGTTNAENVVVSGDLTSDGDLSITNATVSGELDVPTPTSDNMAANKKYVDGKFGYVESVDGYLNFYSDSSKTTLIQSIQWYEE